MKGNNRKVYIRALISLLTVLLIIFVIFKVYITSEHPLDSDIWKISFDEGWTVDYQGELYEYVNIDDFRLPQVLDKGESVSISKYLPENIEESYYENSMIRIKSQNSIVVVSIGGEVRYSYGLERNVLNKMVGSGYHDFNLEPLDGGKEISITFTSVEHKSFSSFDSISIYNGNTLYQYNLVRGKIPFTISLLLVMLGFCMMIITAIASIKQTKFIELFLAGCISVVIGTWSLCYYGFVQSFDIPIYTSSILEYLALYFFAVPLLLYFKNYVTATGNRKMKRVYVVLIFVQIIADIIVVILQSTGISHFPTSLPFMHVLIAMEMLYVVVLLIMNVKKGDTSSRAILAGTIAMVLCIIAEYIIYIFKKYTGENSVKLQGFAAMGTLVFVFTLITAFVMQVAQQLKITTEKAVLYRMAYTDELTRLYNRRFCEQRLKILVTEHRDYGIINLDLNDLKGVNDTGGHPMGDCLIAGFAQILRNTFDKVGTVGRMGGDEFIVIIDDTEGFYYEKYIAKLMDNIRRANENEDRFVYSTSYGYAESHEIEQKLTGTDYDPELVYILADQRMYEYKRASKNSEVRN